MNQNQKMFNEYRCDIGKSKNNSGSAPCPLEHVFNLEVKHIYILTLQSTIATSVPHSSGSR